MKIKDIVNEAGPRDPMSYMGDIGTRSPHRGDPVMSPDLGGGVGPGGAGKGHLFLAEKHLLQRLLEVKKLQHKHDQEKQENVLQQHKLLLNELIPQSKLLKQNILETKIYLLLPLEQNRHLHRQKHLKESRLFFLQQAK